MILIYVENCEPYYYTVHHSVQPQTLWMLMSEVEKLVKLLTDRLTYWTALNNCCSMTNYSYVHIPLFVVFCLCYVLNNYDSLPSCVRIPLHLISRLCRLQTPYWGLYGKTFYLLSMICQGSGGRALSGVQGQNPLVWRSGEAKPPPWSWSTFVFWTFKGSRKFAQYSTICKCKEIWYLCYICKKS